MTTTPSPKPPVRRMRRVGATRAARVKARATAEARLRALIRFRWYTLLGRSDVVPAWRDFDTFFAWAKPRFLHGHCLARIDPELPFGPDNCRFVERGEITTRSLNAAAARARARSRDRILNAVPAEPAGRGLARPVRCIELDRTFPSLTSAAEAAGVQINAITVALRAHGRAAGYRWEYVE
jgi:hypothetical protein